MTQGRLALPRQGQNAPTDGPEAVEADFARPVNVTTEVWAMIETMQEKHSHEDVTGRLWDVLMVAFAAIRSLMLLWQDGWRKDNRWKSGTDL